MQSGAADYFIGRLFVLTRCIGRKLISDFENPDEAVDGESDCQTPYNQHENQTGCGEIAGVLKQGNHFNSRWVPDFQER